MVGISHADVGSELTKAEWSGVNSHIMDSGASFPASPDYGDEFFRHDLGATYFYSSQYRNWKTINEKYALGPRDFMWRVGVYRTWYIDNGWGVLEYHTRYYGSGEESENNSSALSYKHFSYGTYEFRILEVASGNTYVRSGRQTFWGFENEHGRPTKGIICLHHHDDGYRLWTSDGSGERGTYIATKNDWSKERVFKVDWQSSEVKFYIDNTLVASHAGAGQIPNASLLEQVGHGGSGMQFFWEGSHPTYKAGQLWASSIQDYTKVLFNFSSFKRID